MAAASTGVAPTLLRTSSEPRALSRGGPRPILARRAARSLAADGACGDPALDVPKVRDVDLRQLVERHRLAPDEPLTQAPTFFGCGRQTRAIRQGREVLGPARIARVQRVL